MTHRHFAFSASFVFGLLLLVSFAEAAPQQIAFNAEIPARQMKDVRIRNVPMGGLVTVDIKTGGDITVLFLSNRDYSRLPSVVRPLFRGQTDSELSFSVTAPAAGTYFLIFDNREGNLPRAIEATIRGYRGSASDTAQAMLGAFEQQMHKLFIFDSLTIHIKNCGVPLAMAGKAGIVICAEYVKKLFDTLGDKAKAGNAFLFTLFHEMGHLLLQQWNYPFFDNEEVVDEFATAVMVMLGQKERVRAKAEFFAANPSVAEAIAKLFRDDRHPVSAQRARNILRWINDPELVRKWQKIFVPHLQTAVLERLQQRSPAWSDRELIDKELTARR